MQHLSRVNPGRQVVFICTTAIVIVGLPVTTFTVLGQVSYEQPQDVTHLWAGYDPGALPFDVEIQKTWEEACARFSTLYFTSEVWEGEPARVFAHIGIPLNAGKVPGILHLHGGGQTASLDWIRFWTKRGYAVASIDWLGKWQDRTDYTRWGKVKGDMAVYGNARDTKPNMRHAAWYHWTIAARRMLTLLEREDNVDGSRLGVFGVSMGASLTWMVAGCDPRIKAAVPIYGCGWNTYPDVHSGMGYHHPVPPEIELWRATMEPETYARYITCPVLLLDATNDFHANMDRCYDSLARVRADTRQAFTLRYSHHLEPAEGRNLPLWMDTHLKGGPPWPASPRIECQQTGGKLLVHAIPDRPAEVTAVQVACAAGERRPQARFWRSLPATLEGQRWRAEGPIIDPSLPLRFICNVTYAAGYTLTSSPAIVIPSSLGITTPTDVPSTLIDDFRDGIDDWTYAYAYTDPCLELAYLQRVLADSSDRYALTLNPAAWGGREINYMFGTHKAADPKWRAPADSRLAFRYRAASATALEVHVSTDHWGPQQKLYIAVLSPEPRDEWQSIVVEANQCKTVDGSILPAWRIMDRLDFKGTAPASAGPQFGSIEWR